MVECEWLATFPETTEKSLTSMLEKSKSSENDNQAKTENIPDSLTKSIPATNNTLKPKPQRYICSPTFEVNNENKNKKKTKEKNKKAKETSPKGTDQPIDKSETQDNSTTTEKILN